MHTNKRKSGAPSHYCRFSIQLRADDAPVLQAARERLGGIGTMIPRPARQTAKPQIVWTVQDQAACLGLVTLFRAYPLRAKKLRDFRVWARAVEEWTSVDRDWEKMARFKEILSMNRTY